MQLIESGQLNSSEMNSLLKLYLKPMLDENIDYLVLGCTHYPYLIPQLIELLPKHVKIIDSGQAVARQTKTILEKHELLNLNLTKSKNDFFTNGNPKVMKQLLQNGFNVAYLDF